MLIVPHEAMEKNLRYPFEVLFRSMMQLLIDTISPEHEFDMEFFAKMDLFAAIFDKTIAVYIVRNTQRCVLIRTSDAHYSGIL